MSIKKSLFLVSFLSLLILPSALFAQTEGEEPTTIEVDAVIERVSEEKLEPADEVYQVVDALVLSEGEYEGSVLTIDSREGYLEDLRYVVDEGQKVKLMIIALPGVDEPLVYITDINRLGALFWLFLLFIAVVLGVGSLRGLGSLIGLGAIVLVLFGFILPQILKGSDPIFVTIIGSAVILAFSIFGTHGFKKITLGAFFGTIGGLIITGALAFLFVTISHLSGLGGEEASLLQLKAGVSLNAQGLFLAAIILGAVGVLDDVAVNQSEIIHELKKTNPDMGASELIKRSMRIGRHHIASVVNTLVLAYAGASLPLLLLFVASDQSTLHLINSELIAEEIVRTLVGTIGLICAVPLATWFTVLMLREKK